MASLLLLLPPLVAAQVQLQHSSSAVTPSHLAVLVLRDLRGRQDLLGRQELRGRVPRAQQALRVPRVLQVPRVHQEQVLQARPAPPEIPALRGLPAQQEQG